MLYSAKTSEIAFSMMAALPWLVLMMSKRLAQLENEGQAESQDMGEMKSQIESYNKERAALKTIIEDKFGTLVADIGRSVSEAEDLVCISSHIFL